MQNTTAKKIDTRKLALAIIADMSTIPEPTIGSSNGEIREYVEAQAILGSYLETGISVESIAPYCGIDRAIEILKELR